MSVLVECPECGAEYNVKDSFIGRTVPCKECGAKMKVRGGSSSGRSRGKRSRSRKSSPNYGLIFGAIGGAGLLLTLLLFLLLRGGGGDPAGEANPFQDANPVANAPIQPVNQNTTEPANLGPTISTTPGRGMSQVTAGFSHWSWKTRTQRRSLGRFEGDPTYRPPADWKIDPDPGQEFTLNPSRNRAIQIKIPDGSGQSVPADVVFPVVPSPVVSVGQHSNPSDRRLVYDLAQQKTLGNINGWGIDTKHAAVSPDGSLFVGLAKDGTAHLWNVEAREESGTVAVGEDADVIAMPTPDQLVACDLSGQKFQVYSLPGGQEVSQFSMGNMAVDKPLIAFSPGGKYVAAIAKGAEEPLLIIHELSSGDRLAEVTIPHFPNQFGGFQLKPVGISFSPDGKLLALGTSQTWNSKLYIIDVATGALVRHHLFGKKLESVGYVHVAFRAWDNAAYHPLYWFPGNKHMLIHEHGIIDVETGDVVYSVPRSGVEFPFVRRPLTADAMTVLNVTGNRGSVFVLELPTEEYKQPDVAEEEEPLFPSVPLIALEPQASQARATGKKVSNIRGTWGVTPDPKQVSAVDVKTAVPIYSDQGILTTIAMSEGSPYAVVSRSAIYRSQANGLPQHNETPDKLKKDREHDFWADHKYKSGDQQIPSWFDLYDLREGKRVAEFELGEEALVTSISPAGDKIVAVHLDRNAFSIRSLPDGKPLGAFEYAASAGVDQMIVSAAWINNDRLITFKGNGDVNVYDTSDNLQRLLTIEQLEMPTWSPGGNYIGGLTPAGYSFYSIDDAACVGSVPLKGTLNAVAWRSDGQRLAMLVSEKFNYFMEVLDLSTGETVDRFPIPLKSTLLRWVGNDHLMVGEDKLIDVSKQAVAWRFEVEQGSDVLQVQPNDGFWFVGEDDKIPVLTGAEALSERVKALLATVELSAQLALKPGDGCSVKVDLQGFDGQFAKGLESQFAGKLQNNGFKVDPNANVTLVIQSREENRGTKTWDGYKSRNGFTFFPNSGDPLTFEAPDREMNVTVAFQISGENAWETKSSRQSFSDSVYFKEGTDPGQAMLESYQNNCRRMFDGIDLPAYVFMPDSANGAGATKLEAQLPTR